VGVEAAVSVATRDDEENKRTEYYLCYERMKSGQFRIGIGSTTYTGDTPDGGEDTKPWSESL
jgi:hypothetical protein